MVRRWCFRALYRLIHKYAPNCWRLNGVKRFITNGDADIKLVLARSEEGSTDGRGLSLFGLSIHQWMGIWVVSTMNQVLNPV